MSRIQPVILLALSVISSALFASPPTDYEKQLQQLSQKLESISPEEPRLRETRAFLLYQYANLAGTSHAYSELHNAVSKLVEHEAELSQRGRLLLSSMLVRLHNLKQASQILHRLPESSGTQLLKADILSQQGHYPEALELIRQLPETVQDWSTLARQAYIHLQQGEHTQAIEEYQHAADSLSAAQMRDYAWLMLQLGKHYLNQGEMDKAWQHYDRADHAFSGWWRVADHQAEWLARAGKNHEAIQLYLQIANKQADCPDIAKTLGDLYQRTGDTESATQWHMKALQSYRNSATAGETQYLHHLVSFYLEIENRPKAALPWAEKDLAIRQSASAHSALARVYHSNGQLKKALNEIERALAFPAPDAETLYTAGLVYLDNGEPEKGHKLIEKALKLNPSFNQFHIHR